MVLRTYFAGTGSASPAQAPAARHWSTQPATTMMTFPRTGRKTLGRISGQSGLAIAGQAWNNTEHSAALLVCLTTLDSE